MSPLPASFLQAVPVAELSKRFLEEAGLPQEAKPNLLFYFLPDILTPLLDMLNEVDFPPDFQHYLSSRTVIKVFDTFNEMITEALKHHLQADDLQEEKDEGA